MSCNVFSAYSDRNLHTTYYATQMATFSKNVKEGKWQVLDTLTSDTYYITKAYIIENEAKVILGHVGRIEYNVETGEVGKIWVDKISIYHIDDNGLKLHEDLQTTVQKIDDKNQAVPYVLSISDGVVDEKTGRGKESTEYLIEIEEGLIEWDSLAY